MWIFLGLVFLAVFLLAQGTVVPVFGEARKARKRLEARLKSFAASSAQGEVASLLREKYLRELSPLERSLETLPGMDRLAKLIEQSGSSTPAYRLVLVSCVIALGGAFFGWMFTRMWHVAALLCAAGFAMPYLLALRKRNRRMAKFDE